jgi:hypothetical protein
LLGNNGPDDVISKIMTTKYFSLLFGSPETEQSNNCVRYANVTYTKVSIKEGSIHFIHAHEKMVVDWLHKYRLLLYRNDLKEFRVG